MHDKKIFAWVSEKYNGVRVEWDGRQLISKGGLVFRAPLWFTLGLPDQPLCGELWMGRDGFEKVLSAIRTGNWQGMQLVVWDVPTHDPIEARILAMEKMTLPKHAFLARQVCGKTKRQIAEYYAEVVGRGGEGIVLRWPGSLYEQYEKLKHADDTEGVVVGYTQGAGKYSGQVGALIIEAWGLRFKVGSGLKDAVRAAPPALGARVTFRYCGRFASGMPNQPRFVAVRDYE